MSRVFENLVIFFEKCRVGKTHQGVIVTAYHLQEVYLQHI